MMEYCDDCEADADLMITFPSGFQGYYCARCSKAHTSGRCMRCKAALDRGCDESVDGWLCGACIDDWAEEDAVAGDAAVHGRLP